MERNPNRNSIPIVSTERVEIVLKEMGFIKEANLIRKIRMEVPFGRLTLITREGRIERIEREVEYDNLSTGL